MSATFTPNGMRPVGRLDGPVTGQIREFDVTADNASLMAVGEPVALVGGTIVSLAASPTTTFSANTPIGVFEGCSYVDEIRGFVNSPTLPANAVTAGLKRIKASIDMGRNLFSIQANGPVAQTKIGADIGFTAASLNTGTRTSRYSKVSADTGTLNQTSGGVAALKIVGFERYPDNVAGDAYTRLLVEWNAGVHALDQAGAH